MAKTSEAAIELVSRCWCHPETENLNPNMPLSMIMAAKVDEMLLLLKEASELMGTDMDLSMNAKKVEAWEQKYDQWLRDNHIHPDDTKEIVVPK